MAEQLYQRLSEDGLLNPQELQALLPGLSHGDFKPVETQWELTQLLGEVAGCETVDLSKVQFHQEALNLVPAKVARTVRVLPLYLEGGTLVVAQYDPLDVLGADRIRRICSCEVRVVCAPREQLLRYMDIHYGSQEQATVEKWIETSRTDVRARQEHGVRKQRVLFPEYEADLGRPSVEQLVEAIVSHAVKKRATDIHITCHADRVELRHRVDGVLREGILIPKEIHPSLVSRIKLSAGLDITTHRFPQEGNFDTEVEGTRVQVRTSVFPTIHGEDIALRLLHRAMYLKDMATLGFSERKLELFTNLLDNPKGMILVTGPVGVGKTTTLYSALTRLAQQGRRVVTLEDPVECKLEHIAQSQVSPQTGYDFARGLRSILRMDPDVVMVGEIRDVETAQMALRASLTGIMVMSTLHTDRAAGAMPRLLDMEVEPYLLTSSLLGVLSQALVRVICEECKEPARPDPRFIESHGLPAELAEATLWRGAGCDRCEGTGYYGRTGIFELLCMDDQVREATKRRADTAEIHKVARQQGMQTIVEDGLEKARQGITTLEEVVRVTAGR